jgi:hypothetical protein
MSNATALRPISAGWVRNPLSALREPVGETASHRPCPHQPPCPPSGAVDRAAARIVVSMPEQGWGLRCNGVITFDDTGELLPDRRAVPPDRGPAPHRCH